MKIILKSEKICEGAYLKKKKATSLLKTGYFMTLNLKERQKIDDLKLFKNWSGFKII